MVGGEDSLSDLHGGVSATGACNHRCTYCGLDFTNYQPRYLDVGILKERLSELGRLGLKSIMYAGEGEPFLHQHMLGIINHTKKSGIDTAVATNGVLFNKEIAEKTRMFLNAGLTAGWMK